MHLRNKIAVGHGWTIDRGGMAICVSPFEPHEIPVVCSFSFARFNKVLFYGEVLTTPTAKERLGAHVLSPVPREVDDPICLESPGGNIRPRMHARMAIVGVRSPGVIRVESRRSIVVESDCLLIVPPLELYGLQSLPSSDSSAITVLVKMPELKDVAVNRLPALLSEPNLLDSWTVLVGDVERTISRIECGIALPSLIERCIAQSTPLPPAHASGWVAPLRPLRDYMQAHLDESIPTTKLVAISGLTASHCIRAFGRQFGLPPHAYHVQLRLAAACELLAKGLRVSTVAYDCGFADQSHLSRKFKEAYGLAPAVWAALVMKTDVNTCRGNRVDVEPRARQQPTNWRTPFSVGKPIPALSPLEPKGPPMPKNRANTNATRF